MVLLPLREVVALIKYLLLTVKKIELQLHMVMEMHPTKQKRTRVCI